MNRLRDPKWLCDFGRALSDFRLSYFVKKQEKCTIDNH